LELVHATPDRWVAHSWPYSTMLDLAAGILPAIAFIWLGLLVYLIFPEYFTSTPSPKPMKQEVYAQAIGGPSESKRRSGIDPRPPVAIGS
jgi:hypothetical protein